MTQSCARVWARVDTNPPAVTAVIIKKQQKILRTKNEFKASYAGVFIATSSGFVF